MTPVVDLESLIISAKQRIEGSKKEVKTCNSIIEFNKDKIKGLEDFINQQLELVNKLESLK